jgi:hypothetical protein
VAAPTTGGAAPATEEAASGRQELTANEVVVRESPGSTGSSASGPFVVVLVLAWLAIGLAFGFPLVRNALERRSWGS